MQRRRGGWRKGRKGRRGTWTESEKDNEGGDEEDGLSKL
jgi:hypothetical protein